MEPLDLRERGRHEADTMQVGGARMQGGSGTRDCTGYRLPVVCRQMGSGEYEMYIYSN